MPADSVVCHIQADSRALLTAERPALNFLQLLAATASVTRRHVDAIAGASPNPRGCAILDTRKTCPACARRRSTRCASAAARTSGWRCGTAS